MLVVNIHKAKASYPRQLGKNAHDRYAALLLKLPDIHRDPFDRILICQAIANQMTLLTPDPLITQYPVLTHG